MDHGTYRAVSDGYTMYLITGEGESMKRLAVLILSGIMAAGALTGCTMNSSLVKTETTQVKDDSEKKIAFIIPTNNFDYFVYIGAMAIILPNQPSRKLPPRESRSSTMTRRWPGIFMHRL